MLILTRLDRAKTHTRGVLHLDGARPWVTMERPWIPGGGFGVPNESCIPEGRYRLVQAVSPKYGREMWYVVGDGVVLRRGDKTHDYERWGVMFHSANFADQLAGCIAPGMEWATMREAAAVTNSRSALAELTRALYGAHSPSLIIR